MRINKYKTKLDETGLAVLVREEGKNYACDGYLNEPEKIVKMLNECFDMCRETEEYCYLLCFNTKHKLLGVFELSHGSAFMSVISVREIMQKALLCNASCIALAHNHPSGDPTPSRDDKESTNKVKKACELMNIQFSDHLVVGRNCFYSFYAEKNFYDIF